MLFNLHFVWDFSIVMIYPLICVELLLGWNSQGNIPLPCVGEGLETTLENNWAMTPEHQLVAPSMGTVGTDAQTTFLWPSYYTQATGCAALGLSVEHWTFSMIY